MEISTIDIIITAVLAGAGWIIKEIIKKVGENGDQKIMVKRIGIVILSVILIIGILINLSIRFKRIAKVYRSRISCYESAGFDYESFEELYENGMTETEIYKAFSITSDVRNDGEKSSSIEEIRCDILDLEPINEPIIRMDADIVDDTLKLFAFNDGWGNSEPLIIKTAAIFKEESLDIIANLDTIAQRTYVAEEPSLASGDAVLLAEYKLDGNKFEESFDSAAEIGVITKEDDRWGATLVYEDNKFHLEYGGGDGVDTITTKRFRVLNVDKAPTSLTFKNVTDIPLIDNVMHIITVVAPTKSCVVECKNVFSINGKRQETDVFEVKVYVPVFDDYVIEQSGPLTNELAHLQNQNKRKIKNIIKKYLYDPNSILDTFSETY